MDDDSSENMDDEDDDTYLDSSQLTDAFGDSMVEQVLKQNLNINRKDNSKQVKGMQKSGQNDDGRIVDDKDAKQMQKDIDKIIKDQKLLEEDMRDRERKGWDLKFQNYWGQIVSNNTNQEHSQVTCEKLFKHVGKFREEAEKNFEHIINNIHRPKIGSGINDN